jgi:hypothetical protein
LEDSNFIVALLIEGEDFEYTIVVGVVVGCFGTLPIEK